MPGRAAVVATGAIALAAFIALVIGVAVAHAAGLTAVAFLGLAGLSAWDYHASHTAWRRSMVRMTRGLPAAFAIGAKKQVELIVDVEGTDAWSCELYDHADPTLAIDGMPVSLVLPAGKRIETTYAATPTMRGDVCFAPADVRVRSRWGLCVLLERLGTTDTRRVYPDFSQVARYAWLAGDHRLQEIGIKTYQLRGQGTDFKQLSEYQVGASVRHIDWRATLRLERPIVR